MSPVTYLVFQDKVKIVKDFKPVDEWNIFDKI